MLSTLIRSPILAAVTGACLLLRLNPAAAQALLPLSPAQLELEGDRIESLTILDRRVTGSRAATSDATKFSSMPTPR